MHLHKIFLTISKKNAIFQKFRPKPKISTQIEIFSKILIQIEIKKNLTNSRFLKKFDQNRDFSTISTPIDIYRKNRPRSRFSKISAKIEIFLNKKFYPIRNFSSNSTKMEIFKHILTQFGIFRKFPPLLRSYGNL